MAKFHTLRIVSCISAPPSAVSEALPSFRHPTFDIRHSSSALPSRRTTCVCAPSMIACPYRPSAVRMDTSMYSLSQGPGCSPMSMIPSAFVNASAASTSSRLTPSSTSRPQSGLPRNAPRAMAMGNPVRPVPGIPTPMAFLIILPLNRQVMEAKSAGCRCGPMPV